MTFAGSTLAVAAIGLRRLLRPRPVSQLKVMTGTGYAIVATDEIESLEADGNYLSVTHVSGRTYLMRSTMNAADRLLGSRQFVRVHRSTIVNRGMIRERRRGGVLVLRSGRTVRIGRAFRDRLE
jgi:two-component system LytT family response regulator